MKATKNRIRCVLGISLLMAVGVRATVLRISWMLSLLLFFSAVAIGSNPPEVPVSVVLGADASRVERFAATELSDHLQRILSLDMVPIVSESKFTAEGRKGSAIFIGRTSATERSPKAGQAASLKPDGFAVWSDGADRLFILGQNDRGTLYGVYSFLGRQGVRWPEPGEQNTVIPLQETFSLDAAEYTEEPSLPHRTLRIRHPYSSPEEVRNFIKWQARQKMNVLYWHGGSDDFEKQDEVLAPLVENNFELLNMVQDRGFIIDHSSHCIKRFFKKTPVDLSKQKTEDYLVGVLNDYLDKYPFLDYFGVWSSDGWGGKILSSPEAIPLDYPDGRVITKEIDYRVPDGKTKPCISNTYVDFLNRVENRVRQKHPDVHFTMIAYNKTLLAPGKVKNNPGQLVHVAFRRSYSYGFGSTNSVWNTIQRAEFDHWLKACDRMVLYEYYQAGALGSIGRPFPHTIAEDLKYLEKVGAAGTASQSRCRLFRNVGPNYYTYAKCSWNTETDVDEVLMDYYRGTYGPEAAPVAKQLFDLWEDTWNSGGDFFRYDWEVIVPLFTQKRIDELIALSREAVNIATRVQQDAQTSGADTFLQHAKELRTVIRGVDLFFRYARGEKQQLDEIKKMNANNPFILLPFSVLNKTEYLHQKGF